MLSFLYVKTGVVSYHLQSANELHDKSESTSRWAWLGTLNLKKSTLRRLNWSWWHLTLKKAQVFPSEWSVLLSLLDHQWQRTLHRSDKYPHYDAIKEVIIFTSQGQDRGKINIMRSSTRSKRTKWYSRVPLTPHQGTHIFPINFHDVVSYFGNFRQSLIQVNGSITSHSKDFKFWTLADR